MNILGDPFSLSSSTSGFDKIQNINPNPPQTNKKKRNQPGTPGNITKLICLSMSQIPSFSKKKILLN
jgi:hypothetical protein